MKVLKWFINLPLMIMWRVYYFLMDSKRSVLFDSALFGIGIAALIYCILPDGWKMKDNESFSIYPIIILGGVVVVYSVLFIARKVFWYKRI